MTPRLLVFEALNVIETLCRLTDQIESAVYSDRFTTICRMEVPQVGGGGADTHDSDPTHATAMACKRLDDALSVCALRVTSNVDV